MKGLSLLLLLSFAISAVEGWGKKGHEMVANLAYRLVNNETRAVIDAMLQNETEDDCIECSSLAIVADWADQVRYGRYHWSTPLHYVDVRDDLLPNGCLSSDTCRYNATRDCPDDFCVAGAIVNYTSRLQDYNEVEALKFIVHFVGDIHQPLHVSRSTDRGGNDINVKFDKTSTSSVVSMRNRVRRRTRHGENLHAVWDDGIIEKWLHHDCNASRLVAEEVLWDFIASNTDNDWLDCPDGGSPQCTSAWAEESLEYALLWAYTNVNGDQIVDGTKLEYAYYATRLSIVKERLAVAGVRLASTLTAAFRMKEQV
jgi:hypothetical protein